MKKPLKKPATKKIETRRPGRPPGSLSQKTRERIEATQEAIREAKSKLTRAQVKAMTPLEVMYFAMHAKLMAGDAGGAAIIARDAAPYVHAKQLAMPPENNLPAELMADPPAVGDEPGPENPVH